MIGGICNILCVTWPFLCLITISYFLICVTLCCFFPPFSLIWLYFLSLQTNSEGLKVKDLYFIYLAILRKVSNNVALLRSTAGTSKSQVRIGWPKTAFIYLLLKPGPLFDCSSTYNILFFCRKNMWVPFAQRYSRRFQILFVDAKMNPLRLCQTRCTVEKWRYGLGSLSLMQYLLCSCGLIIPNNHFPP